ncbi:DUF1039 domain-containing protein [Apirhabdus apintestini]|uniref:DUF1039 domain-containing protein n=1 Tax=Erwinia sp. HR93 TaxID=3094840 RepID=UPI002ADEE107|nr:DUF1039 domain-containing protein [Erwinia sp. HR93]MEA1063789.1 DUF1039 domain-containing protein [Erwinia sp. HR93]WPM83951.1 DUF1039 domain-containing protein [Enterobacteriaceae bacterium CA-0114]
MVSLPRSLRRLLVMSALAAANHRLSQQACCLRDALPWLIPDAGTRQQCDDILALFLDSPYLTSPDYNPLEQLLSLAGS